MAGKYQAYPEYKSTGVSWLPVMPKSWQVTKLKYLIGALESGVSVNAADYPKSEGELGVLKTSCVYTRTFRAEENKTVFVEENFRVKCLVKSGSIIISRMNTPDLVGAAAYVDSDYKDLYLPDRLWQTVYNDETVQNSKYVHYFMFLRGFRDQISNYAEGASSSMQNIAKEDFLSINILLPSRSEQENIVKFLDHETAKIDTLIEKQQQLIKLLKEKRQAVISHAVTKGLNPNAPMCDSGVEWLGGVPEHWGITRLKYQVEMLPGFAFKSTGFVDSSEEINLLRGINITPGKVRWDETVYWPSHNNDDLTEYVLQEKDLVLGMDRPWVGGGLRLAMLSKEDLPAYVVQRIARIRGVHGVSQEYLFELLSAPSFSSYFDPITTGVSVPHISTDQIGEYYFALPPKSERQEIVEFIGLSTSKYKKLMNGAERAIKLMQERRTALISAAVTGKIDVRNWQAPAPSNTNNKEVAA